MKRRAIIFGALAVAVLLLVRLRGCFLPEEERIRRAILSMADGFNRSRAGQAVAGLAEDFIEETLGRDRTEVRAYLAALFLTQRDPQTKEFRHRIEVEDLTVTLDPERGDRAEVSAIASFLTIGPGREPAWRAEFSARLERTRDGWMVTRSSHRALGGRRPF